jgi:DNA-binding transcriptional ArsR family regulator
MRTMPEPGATPDARVAMPGAGLPPDTRVDAVFAALADPTRREVIGRLAQEPASASRLALELPITRQAVAKHLAALDRAGLVASRREGRELRYMLNPEPMGDAMAWMASVGASWDERLARLAKRAAPS